MPRIPVATLKQYLTEDEVKTLLDFVRWRATRKGAARRYVTDRAMVETFLFSAVRNAELRALNFSALPAYHQTMVLAVVNGKGGKSRDVPIPEQLAELLLDYAVNVRGATADSDPETPLFVGRKQGGVARRIICQTITARIKNVGRDCAKACADPNSQFHGRDGNFTGKNYLFPHKLRYVAATRFYEESEHNLRATQLYLGHSNVAVTSRYLQQGTEKLSEIAKNIYV